ncbi:UNVERIFIED_CONTAM: alpha-ribazole phosphatase [Acetivibrio alkalicellulosi]
MLEIILVRHGETNGNKKGEYFGFTDQELNEEGINQAILLKERLKDLLVDKIYSSPLKRAKKTAEIINENFGLPIEYSHNLKERNFGIWEGMVDDEIRLNFPYEYEKWINDWKGYSIKDGESAIESFQRVESFIRDNIEWSKKGRYLIVTHLGTIRYIIVQLLGMKIEDSWRFRVGNCGMVKIQITDGYGVLTL